MVKTYIELHHFEVLSLHKVLQDFKVCLHHHLILFCVYSHQEIFRSDVRQLNIKSLMNIKKCIVHWTFGWNIDVHFNEVYY